MKKLYLVTAVTGEYSGREEIPLYAYEDEETASSKCDRLLFEYDKIRKRAPSWDSEEYDEFWKKELSAEVFGDIYNRLDNWLNWHKMDFHPYHSVELMDSTPVPKRTKAPVEDVPAVESLQETSQEEDSPALSE